MVTTDDCIAQLFVCATRVCLLDTDGSPLAGAGSAYVSDALAKATISPVYDEGDEIKEKNACGATYIDVLSPPTLVRYNLSLDFLTPDPYLHAILLSQGQLLSASGARVGFQFPKIGVVEGDGVSIEFFTQRMVDGAISQVHPYAQWALPRVINLRVGDRDLTNAAQHSLITGEAYENANWADGPENDFDGDSTAAVQWLPADDLPDVQCGPITVEAS